MNVIILSSLKMLSGGLRQALYLAAGLKARGHRVHLVSPACPEVQEAARKQNVPWVELPDGWRAAGRCLRSLMPPAETGEPTVVHAFHNRGVKLAAYFGTLWRLQRLPVVCVAHRGVISRPHNPLPYLLPGIRAFLVNSKACAATLPLLWRRSRCHVVNNSIPESRLKVSKTADQVRAELAIPPGHFVVGDIGSYQTRKAVDRLIMAYAQVRDQLPPSTLVVVGVENRHWMPLAESLGLAEHVRFVPRTPSVSEYVQIFDLFVFPPYSVESQPNVVLEAMLMDVPVIASRIGGVPEILPERCLFKAGDVAEMAAKMVEVINSPEMLKSMVEENSRNKHLYTLDHRLDVLLGHYHRLLKEDGLER